LFSPYIFCLLEVFLVLKFLVLQCQFFLGLPRKTNARSSIINASPPSIVSPCFSASSGITSSPTMKFDARPTNLCLRDYPGTASNPIQAYHPNGRQCRCKADLDFPAFCVLEETTRTTADDLDEDGTERPRLPRAVMDRCSRLGPEPTTLEAVGNQWRYALVVVQTGEEEEVSIAPLRMVMRILVDRRRSTGESACIKYIRVCTPLLGHATITSCRWEAATICPRRGLQVVTRCTSYTHMDLSLTRCPCWPASTANLHL